MSDHRNTDINDEPSDLDAPTQAELDAIARILGDAAVWDEPDPTVEDRVVAAIFAEAAQSGAGGPGRLADGPRTSAPSPPTAPAIDRTETARPLPSPVTPEPPAAPSGRGVDARHRFRSARLVLAAAAVVAVVAIGAALLRSSSEPEVGEQVALAATDLAPAGAEGDANIVNRPGGTEIVLDVSGLPPAPEGSYYEAWLRKSPEVGVSAGTFHLRGGDATIVLWAGVSTDDYPLVTVTIQQEGAGAESSGKVVLKGKVGG
jgi:anti-sigma-K factor RskA